MIGRKGATRVVRVVRHRGGGLAREKDTLAIEEPLEIRLSWTLPEGDRHTESIAVTMRTPGEDFELVAGFLHGEGLLESHQPLLELTCCRGDENQDFNVVEARLRPGVAVDPERFRRNFYVSSSCGVCGKASLEAAEAQGCRALDSSDGAISARLLPTLPGLLREQQRVFRKTGGLHGAGLFTSKGRCIAVREDVGRHNAVDKVIGHELLGRSLPASGRILLVSGRASFEIVQKSVAAGVPVLVAVGAPSSLAVDLAQRFNQTLVGFAGEGGFNVYTAPERVT
jgi:FdhD protein